MLYSGMGLGSTVIVLMGPQVQIQTGCTRFCLNEHDSVVGIQLTIRPEEQLAQEGIITLITQSSLHIRL